MSAGSIGGDLLVQDATTANLGGGSIGRNAALQSNSIFSMSGGNIAGNFSAAGFSVFNFSGGVIEGNASFSGLSQGFWSGGTIEGDISLHDQSVLDWTGSAPAGGVGTPVVTSAELTLLSNDSPTGFSIYLYDGSSFEIDGTDLTDALLDPNSGGTFSEYQLFGNLQDGTALPDGLHLFVENGSAASFQLVNVVPEPASIGLLSGMLFLCGRPSRRQGNQRIHT
jgi:hypothetical protein